MGINKKIWEGVRSTERFGNGTHLVKNNDGKFNLIRDNKFIFKEWFDDVDYKSKSDIHSLYKIGSGFNIIRSDGTLVFKDWVEDYIYNMGLNDVPERVGICKDGKWNCMNEDGEFISEEWFDEMSGFREGFCKVRNGKFPFWEFNYMDYNGKLLLDKWILGDCRGFVNDTALCEIKRKDERGFIQLAGVNFVTKSGEFLFKEHFDGRLRGYTGGYYLLIGHSPEGNAYTTIVDTYGNIYPTNNVLHERGVGWVSFDPGSGERWVGLPIEEIIKEYKNGAVRADGRINVVDIYNIIQKRKNGAEKKVTKSHKL